jgi:hypothetical protein
MPRILLIPIVLLVLVRPYLLKELHDVRIRSEFHPVYDIFISVDFALQRLDLGLPCFLAPVVPFARYTSTLTLDTYGTSRCRPVTLSACQQRRRQMEKRKPIYLRFCCLTAIASGGYALPRCNWGRCCRAGARGSGRLLRVCDLTSLRWVGIRMRLFHGTVDQVFIADLKRQSQNEIKQDDASICPAIERGGIWGQANRSRCHISVVAVSRHSE